MRKGEPCPALGDVWLWAQVTNCFSFRLAWGSEQVTGNQEVGDSHSHEYSADSLPTVPCTQLPPLKGPSPQREHIENLTPRQGGFWPLGASAQEQVALAGGNPSERFSAAEHRGWLNVGRRGQKDRGGMGG